MPIVGNGQPTGDDISLWELLPCLRFNLFDQPLTVTVEDERCSDTTAADNPTAVIGKLVSPLSYVFESGRSTLVISLDGGSLGARLERGQIFEAPI